MLERISRPMKRGGLRVLGRCALIAGLSVVAAGCDEGDKIFGRPPVPDKPDYTMSVDCGADPQSRTVQNVIPGRVVQIVMLNLRGEGYQDRWRVQVFPPNSDHAVSRHNGEDPRYFVRASELRHGNPQYVDLSHGSVALREVQMDTGTEATPATAEASPSGSIDPLPDRQLEITLSCAPSPG